MDTNTNKLKQINSPLTHSHTHTHTHPPTHTYTHNHTQSHTVTHRDAQTHRHTDIQTPSHPVQPPIPARAHAPTRRKYVRDICVMPPLGKPKGRWKALPVSAKKKPMKLSCGASPPAPPNFNVDFRRLRWSAGLRNKSRTWRPATLR